jgi:hypothetical protein
LRRWRFARHQPRRKIVALCGGVVRILLTTVAEEFLTGAILHIVYSPNVRDRTLHRMDAFITSGVSTQEEIFEQTLICEHDPEYRYGWVDEHNERTKTHPTVAAAARGMINWLPSEQDSAMAFIARHPQVYHYRREQSARSKKDYEAIA